MKNLKEFKDIKKKSIFDMNENREISNKESIVNYLKNRKYVLFASSAEIYDEYQKKNILNSCKIWYADDLYKWTSQDIYYFENYGLPLNSDFVKHALKTI